MKTTLYFTLTLLTFVMFAFIPNSFAQDTAPEYVVRVIYFIPKDREPDPNMDEKLDTLIKDIRQFYADQMEAHGFGRKTFRFEADDADNVVVHHVNGKFNGTYYRQNPGTAVTRVLNEIEEQFDISKNIYFIALDNGSDYLYGSIDSGGTVEGIGNGNSLNGWAFIPASNFVAAHHELGHAFGLHHDGRGSGNAKRIYTSPTNRDPMLTSFCAAEWLDVHRYFNPNQESFNENTSVKMLTPSLVSPPDNIRLRFEVTDSDGLHQVWLGDPLSIKVVDLSEIDTVTIACQELSNEHATVEFVINEILGGDTIFLSVIDVHGNFTQHSFPINFTSLLPPPEPISIPDPNLAAAVRETLGLASGHTITQIDMLRLKRLDIQDHQISDLTGLEHAIHIRTLGLNRNQIRDITPLSRLTKLRSLILGINSIRDITPLSGLTNLFQLILWDNEISDIKPLARLTNLRTLFLSNNSIKDITHLMGLTNLHTLGLRINQIGDITHLAGLTNLEWLHLNRNQIRDISSLAKLTNLRFLDLSTNQIGNITHLAGLINLSELQLDSNNISDISPLAELTNLKELSLVGNPIKNRKPLLELLRKNPDVKIYLKNNHEPLPVTLSHFRAEHTDAGVILKWTTESEVDNAGFYIYRSQTKDGEFKIVNPSMIQGAGTTGERSTYTWKDTTAKPNIVYYYRIEDISHAGEREQLATARLRGLVSAKGKLTTIWADLKKHQ